MSLGGLGFSPGEAAALPLNRETVETVIARTRAANLGQLGLSALAVGGLAWTGSRTSGAVSGLCWGAAALAMWGVLGAALSTWDHFRTAGPLRSQAAAAIARDPDPVKFWRAHRGLFPYFTR